MTSFSQTTKKLSDLSWSL